MSELGLKQKAVAAVLVMVVLYAVAVATWFLSAEGAWKRAFRQYDRACERYAKETRLIGERKRWDELYEQEKAAMPTFAVGQATDTTWLRRVEDLARSNRVQIVQIEHGKEVEADDVLELPITCKSWEGSLEALVRFMHGLENADNAMFNINAISIRPSNKKGYLKGSASLSCAYMRDE